MKMPSEFKRQIELSGLLGVIALALYSISSPVCSAETKQLPTSQKHSARVIRRHKLQPGESISNIPINHPKHLKSQNLYYEGRGFMDAKQYPKAIGYFTRYIAMHKEESKKIKQESKPSRDYYLSWGYQNRGWCYIQLRDYTRAIDDLTDAIKLRPTYSPNFKNRAACYRLTGRKDLAIKDLTTIRTLPVNTGDVNVDLPAEFARTKRH